MEYCRVLRVIEGTMRYYKVWGGVMPGTAGYCRVLRGTRGPSTRVLPKYHPVFRNTYNYPPVPISAPVSPITPLYPPVPQPSTPKMQSTGCTAGYRGVVRGTARYFKVLKVTANYCNVLKGTLGMLSMLWGTAGY